MRMGELLALSALKFMCGHKMLHRMYANLARDIDYKDLDGYVFTDSYDLAQEAALFLCGYMGKSVFDTCIDPKSGKTYAIRRMCSKILCHKLYEEWKIKADISDDDRPGGTSVDCVLSFPLSEYAFIHLSSLSRISLFIVNTSFHSVWITNAIGLRAPPFSF